MAKTCLCVGCNRPVWSNKYCDRHQQCRTDSKWLATVAKRKEKQSKPIAKVSKKKLADNDGNIWAAGKIKPVSKSQARKDAIYFARLPGWKLENPNCAYPGCNGQTEHCHHKRGRGKYYLVESTWCPLCAEHHMIVENFPDHAKEIGLSESRLAKYDDD